MKPAYPRKKERLAVHIVLFAATLVTTMAAGALLAGIPPFPEEIMRNPLLLLRGIPFSFTLMAILLTHEFAHYFTSRYHNVEATLPYFIPAPHLIGTFGAFIKMKSPINNKKVLLDIGAAGPLAGFVLAVPAVMIGLRLSTVVPIEELPLGTEGATLGFGTSLLLAALIKLVIGSVPEGYNIIIHPVGFAGWIGFLVTSLNLLPIGQLDGGHIACAVFGRRQLAVSRAMTFILVLLGIFLWQGWMVWAILVMILGIAHPPPLDPYTPLDARRRAVAWLMLVIFILTFIPVPIQEVR